MYFDLYIYLSHTQSVPLGYWVKGNKKTSHGLVHFNYHLYTVAGGEMSQQDCFTPDPFGIFNNLQCLTEFYLRIANIKWKTFCIGH